MKAAETKYYDIAFENEQLYHNCGTFQLLFPGFIRAIPQWFNPWSVIGQGTGRMQRIGDKITPRGMSIKLWLANKNDRPTTRYRVIVAILPKVIAGVVTIPRFDPFQLANSGTNGNTMCLPCDSDRGIKFLYDKVITPRHPWVYGTSGGSRENTTLVRLWIRRKRANPIVFDQGTFDINNKPLAVYVIPYEQYSTLNTDNIASCAGYMRMYYKDV